MAFMSGAAHVLQWNIQRAANSRKSANPKNILKSPRDQRLGINGIMAGYLLLTGAKGLEVIEEHKLNNRNAPFSETYAALEALRFMWRYGNGRIAKDRLRLSMRALLGRPELTDLAVENLAKWKDWGVHDKLMQMYGKGEFNVPLIKRAIVRYMLASSKALPKQVPGIDAELPSHVISGRKHLEALRTKDPKTFNSVIVSP